MARIFDPTTREEIQLPEAELNEAVASGKATFAANDLINVIAPDGSSGTIPATKIRDAITQGGFKIESPLQQAVREHVEKNDTLSGSVKVGLDQFANQALFGVPGIIGDKYKNPLEKLKDDAVKDDHQIANAIGGVTGFGASLFAGGPLFKGATKVGTLAEKAVASGLAEVGIKRGAQNIAADLAARVAENATRLGVESAILSTPQAGAHLINGDPELAAETLISNGVLGLGLGTLGGVLSTGGSRITKAFSKSALEGDALKAANTLNKETNKADDLVSVLTKKTPEDITYTKANIKRMEATPSMDEAAEKSIPKMFKEDYDKFTEIDLPAIEKKVESALEKSKVKINTKEISDQIDNIVTQITEAEGLTEQGAKAIDRLQRYKERLIPVSAEGLPQYRDMTGKQVRKYLQGLRKDNSAFRKLNSPTGGDFTLPETVLMDLSEGLSGKLKDKVGPEFRELMKDYAGKVKLSINLDKQLGVNNAFQNRIKKPIQDKALGGYSTISFNDKTNNFYKNIEDFSKMVGKDYPTMINDRLVYAKMFPERALKGDAPTLTARIADLAGKVDLAKPLQTAMNLVAPSSETLLHSYVTNGGIINAATRSMAKINRIPEALNNFISKRIPVTLEGSSVSAIQRFLGTETKSREDQIQELNEKLGEFNENPALATEHMSNTTRQVPENIAAAVTAKNVAIAQYLGSHIPKPRAIPNPFNQNKWKPSDSEISRFERRVQAVENPLSIVDQLETGTLSKETVETVQTLYPKLYEMVQQKVVESMQNHKGPIPYSARMRLSLLMGETFDNSLKPENIRMMQQRFQQKPVQAPKSSGNMNLPSLETQTQRLSSK